MEYTSYAGYGYSTANDLIQNFKKPVSRKSLPEYRYKERAIIQIAQLLAATTGPIVKNSTLVPIPPSKTKTHPDYDDRMVQCLQQCGGGRLDIRELLRLKNNMVSSHSATVRPTVEEIIENMAVDENLSGNLPTKLVLFDDVLTTGAHFKAAKQVLMKRFGQISVIGIFIARRCFPTTP